MANTPKVYVLCDNNCKYESLTKEQIYTAIVQALENGTIEDVNTGFVQTIKTINNIPLKFFVGSQASYDALKDEQKENLFAIISDDTSKENLIKKLEELQTEYESNAARIEEVRKAGLAEVTYIPTAENPLYSGKTSKGSNTFTFNLPNGKTLANLTQVIIKHDKAPLIGVLANVDGVTKCYAVGQGWANSSDTYYSAYITFEENKGDVTGILNSVYQKTTRLENDTKFLLYGREESGNDYIKLYFL